MPGGPRFGTIFDRGLVPDRWGRISGVTDIQAGHTTMFDPTTNERISWDNPGQQNLHGTRQGVGDHPGRHFDPR